MVHFFHKKNKILISTNLKVMYSSLYSTDSLDEIFWKEFLFKKITNIFRAKHYLLVRNPYTRIISFYKDKMQQLTKMQLNKTSFEFQDAQKMFFTSLNIDSNDSKDVIISKLSNTSFVDFIRLLPNHYLKDSHTHLQGKAFFQKKRRFYSSLTSYIFKFKIQIIKIENLEKMNIFAKKIDLDMSLKKNSTQSIETPNLTPETIKIINKIYYDDFTLFGYEML